MDGSRENFLLEQRMKSEANKLYPDIEYTARSMRQLNSLAETGIFVIANRGRALMA